MNVSPELLEAMWGIAAAQGKDSALELGHPTKDVLVVDGQRVAWSAKPKSVAA